MPTKTSTTTRPASDLSIAEDMNAAVSLMQLSDLVTPMVLRVAATLRLADHAADVPVSASALAARTGTEPRPLGKVLDHLVSLELFSSSPEGYQLTAMGRPLLSSADFLGVRPFLDVEHVVGRAELSMMDLLFTVRTGAAAYEARHGHGLWQDLVVQGDAIDGIEAFQHDTALFDAPLVVDAYDWSSVRDVVDVGGNTGAMTAALLLAHPHLRSTVLDLPCFAPGAQQTLQHHGVQDRARFLSGDFFAGLPGGADVYLLSAILADWDDARAVQILQSCRTAAGSTGKALLAEVHLRPFHPDPVQATATAVRLEASMANPDRTVDDLARLAELAGWQVSWRGPTSPVRSLLELSQPAQAQR